MQPTIFLILKLIDNYGDYAPCVYARECVCAHEEAHIHARTYGCNKKLQNHSKKITSK